MAHFSNDAINRVTLHSAIQALAQNAGGVFVLAYLIKAGVPIPLALCVFSAMTLGRFVLRPLVFVAERRLGLRGVILLGTVLEAAIFPILPLIHGVGVMLLAMIVVSSVGSVLYWTAYHAYYAALGDDENRGDQVGLREAANAVIGIVAPVLGAWAILTAGPTAAFWGVAVVQVCAAIPLLGAPDVPISREPPAPWTAFLPGAVLMATDGWYAACFFYVWDAALFVSLGRGYGAFGAAMALAGLVGAAFSLWIGRRMDMGHGRLAIILAYGVAALVGAFKAIAWPVPWLAVSAHAAGALASALIAPAIMTRVYGLAAASPCPLRFHVATEAGWDIGCGLGCLTGGALLAAGQGFSLSLLLGLIGLGAAATALLRGWGGATVQGKA